MGLHGLTLRKEVKWRLHNIIEKPSLQHGSATQVLRAEAKRVKASKMQFLQAYLFHKTLDVQEDEGQNSSFGFGKGRDSIFEHQREE